MRILQSIIWILLTVQFTYSQNASFVAAVDKNRVAMGEQIEITFTLTGTSGGSNFQPPVFNDFLTLSGPNQSTNMQFINGAVSASVSYSYILQPRSEGKFIIGSATINYGGSRLQTPPVTIEVARGSSSSPQQQSRQPQQETDISRQIGDNLFLKVTVDKAKVYQGEQLTASYKLYWRVNLGSNPGVTKMPSLSGFWNEELEVPKQNQVSREIINGKQYNVATLKKVALFPQHGGTLTIDPMELDCIVQVQTKRRSNDLFDQFFNDPFFGNVSNVNYKIRSQALNITVIPLPISNVPKEFAGAVGKFSLEAWLDKNQTKTNEPVALKVKITGRGNLKLLEAPVVNTSSDIERYDPKISDNITNQNDLIAGSRTFEYLLIPRHPGEQKIPSFKFSYFDTDRKEYVSFTSPEFILNIEKGSEAEQTYAVGISKEDVKLLGEDIRFIKSGNVKFRRKGDRFSASPLFYALSISPVLALFGFVLFIKRREKILGNVLLVKNRKARKMAQLRLTVAKKLLHQGKKEEFYTEISKAIYGYIGDKLGIAPADLSIEMICSTLQSREVAAEIISKLTSTINQCEFARFAPATDSFTMSNIYNEAVDLISSIEEQLR